MKTHWVEIRDGGWSAVRKKLKTLYMLLMIYAPWTLLAVLVVRCIRPWRIVRFGPINGQHIGHFIADASQQFAVKQLEAGKRYIDLYWMIRPVCNTFWDTMVRRSFSVYPWVEYLDRLNQKLPGGAPHCRPQSLAKDSRDSMGLYEQSPSRMPFRPEENASGKAWLRSAGWQEGEQFACLLVRDSAYYMNTSHLYNEQYLHDYRDSDIASYVSAAEWLADQGVWVLRMGKIMGRPIPSQHCRIIDYAFHPEKSDFLDIWLFANCNLTITTGSGIDTIGDVYRRPIVFLNCIPMARITSWSDAMHAGKKLVWKSNGVPLIFREYLEHDYNDGMEKYDRAGIKIVDLTSQEILDTVRERWLRLQGEWTDTRRDIELHRRFWDLLKRHPDFHNLHGWIHPEARAATTWLRSMSEDFLR